MLTIHDCIVKLVEDAHQELSNLTELMRVNQSIINTKRKTEFMVIGYQLKTKNLDLPEVLKLNNSDIKRVDKTKSLGVIVDEKRNWEEQFMRTEDKMSGGFADLKNSKLSYHSPTV